MTKRELYKLLKGIPMGAEIILVNAKDYDDVELDIDSVTSYPLDVPLNKRDEVCIVFNEGVMSEDKS